MIYEEWKKQLQTVFQFGGKGEIDKEKNEIYRDQALMTLNYVQKIPWLTYENKIHDLPEQYRNKVNVILSDISDNLAENLAEQEKLEESVKKMDEKRLKERQRMEWIKSAIIIWLLSLVWWNLFWSSEDKDNHDTQDGEETKTEVITTEANDENTIKELER